MNRRSSFTKDRFTTAFILKRTLVFEIGSLNVLHQPSLGEVEEVDTTITCADASELSQEIVVHFLMLGKGGIFCLRHHTLFIREVISCYIHQGFQICITFAFLQVENSVKDTSVLVIQILIHDEEFFAPPEWGRNRVVAGDFWKVRHVDGLGGVEAASALYFTEYERLVDNKPRV